MTTHNPKNIPKTYECMDCKFTSSNKKDYNRHLLTRKHINIMNGYIKPSEYVCNSCDKKLADRASLWKHKKICKGVLKNELREPDTVVEREVLDVSNTVTIDEIMCILKKQRRELFDLIVIQQDFITKQKIQIAKLDDRINEIDMAI